MARKPNPDTVDRVIELSPAEMLAHRQYALNAALTHAGNARAAVRGRSPAQRRTFLMFLMQGEPVYAIEESIQQHLDAPLRAQRIALQQSRPAAPLGSRLRQRRRIGHPWPQKRRQRRTP